MISTDNLRMVDLSQPQPWSWVEMTQMPGKRSSFSTVSDDMDSIYAFGGYETSSLKRDTIFKYSITSNSWITLAATLPIPDLTQSVRVSNNMVWVWHSSSVIKIFDMDSESMTNDNVPTLSGGNSAYILVLDPNLLFNNEKKKVY